ncbi:hypothetical protein [Streptomyces sp. NPDC057910]|uniref:hypothetical protein n=1 Tax=Streptomyces sp. NPDC057910 TaxID=3346278 RepID=UPI0036E2A4B2
MNKGEENVCVGDFDVDFEFELEPVREGQVRGYRGVAGPFGGVEVTTDIGAPGRAPSRQVGLIGARFPETLFSGGADVSPSLDGGWLKVDGTIVDMDLKIKGLRKGSRWLELTFRDRHYTYSVTGSAEDVRFSGDSATIATTRGRRVPVNSGCRRVKVQGDADATDLAIALVLEEVDRSVLSLTGALFALPRNVLFGRSRDEGLA